MSEPTNRPDLNPTGPDNASVAGDQPATHSSQATPPPPPPHSVPPIPPFAQSAQHGPLHQGPPPQAQGTAPGGSGPGWGPPPGYYPPPWAWMSPPPPPKKKRSPLGWIFGGSLLLGLLMLVAIALINRMPGSESSGLGFGRQVGLVRIQGVIMQDEAKEFWMDSLKRLAENNSVQGVVVRIDSPGGAVGASQELQAALERLSNEHGKTVYVSMGDTAASGGYYIASAADRIFALKGTLTGSIGVIMSLPKVHELAGKVGYKTEVIKSGRFKDAWSSMRDSTEIERQMMQGLITNAYDQFVDDILKHREEKLTTAANALPAEAWERYLFNRPGELTAKAYLHQVADGRVYSGEQAFELGLVDQLGTLEETIDALGTELGIAGEPDVLEYKPRKGLMDLLNAKVESFLPATHASLQYIMLLD